MNILIISVKKSKESSCQVGKQFFGTENFFSSLCTKFWQLAGLWLVKRSQFWRIISLFTIIIITYFTLLRPNCVFTRKDLYIVQVKNKRKKWMNFKVWLFDKVVLSRTFWKSLKVFLSLNLIFSLFQSNIFTYLLTFIHSLNQFFFLKKTSNSLLFKSVASLGQRT